MVQQNPQMRAMLTNPDLMRNMMTPENINAAMGMMGGQGGMPPGMGGGMPPGMGGFPAMGGMPPGMGGFPGMGGMPPGMGGFPGMGGGMPPMDPAMMA
jgi:hypothetical protein